MISTTIHCRSTATGKTRTCDVPVQFRDADAAEQFIRAMDAIYPDHIHTWQQVDFGVMTAAAAVAQLKRMDGGRSKEDAHIEADEILCKVLKAAGPEYAAVADAYYAARDRVGFWYA